MIANRHESTMKLTNSNENKSGSRSLIITVYDDDENEKEQMQNKWRKVIQNLLRGSLLLFVFIAVYILFMNANTKSTFIMDRKVQSEGDVEERNSLPNEGECWICYELILEAEPTVTLHPTCKHKFHAECIDRWYSVGMDQGTCPTCRGPVIFRMRTHCMKCKDKFEERADGEPVMCKKCRLSSKQIVGQPYGDVDQTKMSATDKAGMAAGGFVVSFVLNLFLNNPCMAKSNNDPECTTAWFIFAYLPAMFMFLFLIFVARALR